MKWIRKYSVFESGEDYDECVSDIRNIIMDYVDDLNEDVIDYKVWRIRYKPELKLKSLVYAAFIIKDISTTFENNRKALRSEVIECFVNILERMYHNGYKCIFNGSNLLASINIDTSKMNLYQSEEKWRNNWTWLEFRENMSAQLSVSKLTMLEIKIIEGDND